MKLIYNIIKNSLGKEPVIGLGRWKITYEKPKISIKTDMANEDHCGPCGEYILQKNKNYESKRNNDNDIILDDKTKK